MKILIAILSITIVCTPATGLKPEHIKSSNFAVNYGLEVNANDYKQCGSFKLNDPPQYVSSSENSSSISILVNPTILINGIRLPGQDTNIIIIESGMATSFGFGPEVEMYTDSVMYTVRDKLETSINFILNIYLLGVPEPKPAAIKVGVEVVVSAKQLKSDQETIIDGVVVLMDNVTYVMISKPIPEDYKDLTIKTPKGDQEIYKFKSRPEIKGPFVAIPTELE